MCIIQKRGRARRLTVAILFGLLLAHGFLAGVRADELPDFTGYTRPGLPSGKAAEKDGKIIFVASEGEKSAILGGTVHFTVIDLKAVEPDDPWLRAAKRMIAAFV